jgi:hypothetical protein
VGQFIAELIEVGIGHMGEAVPGVMLMLLAGGSVGQAG